MGQLGMVISQPPWFEHYKLSELFPSCMQFLPFQYFYSHYSTWFCPTLYTTALRGKVFLHFRAVQTFLSIYRGSTTSFFIYSAKDPSAVSFPLQGLTQFDFWQFALHSCTSWPPKTYLSLLLNPLSKAALMCRWTRQLSRAAGCWGVIKGPQTYCLFDLCQALHS